MSLSDSPSTAGAGTASVPVANNPVANNPVANNPMANNGPPSRRALVPVPARPETVRQMSLPALLMALQRRWLLASVLGGVAMIAVAASVWTLLPAPKTVVRAVVHIAAKPEIILDRRPHDAGDFSNFQKTQMTVVKSQLVLRAALSQPDVATLAVVREPALPVEWVMQELEVDFANGPEVLRIVLKGENADELKVLVNAVMTAYLREFINNERVKQRERLDHLTTLKQERETKLREKRKVLEAFAPKLGVGD